MTIQTPLATNTNTGVVYQVAPDGHITPLYVSLAGSPDLATADSSAVSLGIPAHLDEDVTLSASTSLTAEWIGYGGVITLGSFNLTGSFWADPNTQMFNASGSGVVTFNNPPTVSVCWFGAIPDATLYATTASMSSSVNPTTLTIASGSFTASQSGKKVTVIGAGAAGAPLTATGTFVDATHMTLSSPCLTTVSAVNAIVYTADASPAIQAAANSTAPSIYAPSFGYYMGSEVTFPARVQLFGNNSYLETVFYSAVRDAPVFQYTAQQNHYFHDFTIYGLFGNGDTGHTAQGIRGRFVGSGSSSSRDCFFDRLTIRELSDAAITVYDSFNCEFKNLRFLNTFQGVALGRNLFPAASTGNLFQNIHCSFVTQGLSLANSVDSVVIKLIAEDGSYGIYGPSADHIVVIGFHGERNSVNDILLNTGVDIQTTISGTGAGVTYNSTYASLKNSSLVMPGSNITSGGYLGNLYYTDTQNVTITGNTNNLALPATATGWIQINCSGGSNFNVTGIAGGSTGQDLYITGGTGGVTLVNNSGSSSSGNRFSLGGANRALPVNSTIHLRYSAGAWFMLGAPSI
jgi:hypothetical protein